MLLQIVVAAREVVVAEPSAAVGRERRRMHRLEHEMALAVDELLLGARIAAPENEHEVLALGAKRADGGIGELLPASSLMGVRLMGTNRQNSV